MGVLLMASTIGVLIFASVGLAISIYTKKVWLRNFVFGGVAVWFVFYFAMLVGFSLKSEERELAVNEAKEFCGFYLDCHLHTPVTGVRRAKTIGNKTAVGEFYIVTVKVFSDAKQATLSFGGLKFHVIDADGNLYRHSPEAEPPEPWFVRPVPPGNSFERDVVFDLPTSVKNPRLDVHDDRSLLEKFVVADEDSMFHKRTYFRLAEAVQTAGMK